MSLAVLISFVAGCDKAPNTETLRSGDQKPQVKAEPFHGEVYRPLRGDTVLTLVSSDECELRQGQRTLLCKYTKQPDALRVVMTALGTNEVIYYKITEQGLQTEKGETLFSSELYSERLAKRAAAIAESKKITETIFKFKIRSFYQDLPVIGEAEVLSNGIQFDAANGEKQTRSAIWYGDLVKVGAGGGYDDKNRIIVSYRGGYVNFPLKDENEAQDVLVRLSRIVGDWKKRYQAIVDEGP